MVKNFTGAAILIKYWHACVHFDHSKNRRNYISCNIFYCNIRPESVDYSDNAAAYNQHNNIALCGNLL
jgi:hypothetical protein